MSFADLSNRFEAVASYIVTGERTLTDFMNMIKMRIECEEAQIVALRKIGNSNWSETEHSTMFEAIDAFRCDALNNAKVKGEFVESLRIDVLESVAEMHRGYSKTTAKLLQQGRDATRNLKIATDRNIKAAIKCEKLNKEAAEAREKLMEARNANPPQPAATLAKLAEQVNDKMDDAADALLRSEEARTTLVKFRKAYDEGMVTVMSGLQAQDDARANNLKAALRRHLVIETSFLANRQYDGNALVSVFEEIDPEADLEKFTTKTLGAVLPSLSDTGTTPLAAPASSSGATPSAATPSSSSSSSAPVPPATPMSAAAAASAAAVDYDLSRKPLPYVSQKRRRAAQRRPKKDLVEDLTFWMGNSPSDKESRETVDDIEELYLGDLIGRLAEQNDLSSVEMKKLNQTLAALKAEAPFALLRVFLHFTRDNQIMMDDHAFDFFTQLLKNMLRKFLQLQDMIAAKLVTSITKNILRLESGESAWEVLEANQDTAPVEEWESKFFDSCEPETAPDGVVMRPEDVLQQNFAMFVDAHGVEPRQTLEVLAEIAASNDDVMDPDRFQRWLHSMYQTFEPVLGSAPQNLLGDAPSASLAAATLARANSVGASTPTVQAPMSFSTLMSTGLGFPPSPLAATAAPMSQRSAATRK